MSADTPAEYAVEHDDDGLSIILDDLRVQQSRLASTQDRRVAARVIARRYAEPIAERAYRAGREAGLIAMHKLQDDCDNPRWDRWHDELHHVAMASEERKPVELRRAMQRIGLLNTNEESDDGE